MQIGDVIVDRVGFKDAKCEKVTLETSHSGPMPHRWWKEALLGEAMLQYHRSLGTWAISCTLHLRHETSNNLLTPSSS